MFELLWRKHFSRLYTNHRPSRIWRKLRWGFPTQGKVLCGNTQDWDISIRYEQHGGFLWLSTYSFIDCCLEQARRPRYRRIDVCWRYTSDLLWCEGNLARCTENIRIEERSNRYLGILPGCKIARKAYKWSQMLDNDQSGLCERCGGKYRGHTPRYS